MKYLLIFFVMFSGSSLFSQAVELPPKPKTGECYIKCVNDSRENNWRKVDCEFVDLVKDEQQLKTLQIKLHNLGYEVDVSGKLNDKTIEAYLQYMKDKKKRKRNALKSKRKSLKKNPS